MPAPSFLLAVEGERARDTAVTGDIALMYHLLKGFHEYLTRCATFWCFIAVCTEIR